MAPKAVFSTNYMTTQVTLVITTSGINKQVLTMIFEYTSGITSPAINLKNAILNTCGWRYLTSVMSKSINNQCCVELRRQCLKKLGHKQVFVNYANRNAQSALDTDMGVAVGVLII